MNCLLLRDCVLFVANGWLERSEGNAIERRIRCASFICIIAESIESKNHLIAWLILYPIFIHYIFYYFVNEARVKASVEKLGLV